MVGIPVLGKVLTKCVGMYVTALVVEDDMVDVCNIADEVRNPCIVSLVTRK